MVSRLENRLFGYIEGYRQQSAKIDLVTDLITNGCRVVKDMFNKDSPYPLIGEKKSKDLRVKLFIKSEFKRKWRKTNV